MSTGGEPMKRVRRMQAWQVERGATIVITAGTRVPIDVGVVRAVTHHLHAVTIYMTDGAQYYIEDGDTYYIIYGKVSK